MSRSNEFKISVGSKLKEDSRTGAIFSYRDKEKQIKSLMSTIEGKLKTKFYNKTDDMIKGWSQVGDLERVVDSLKEINSYLN